MGGNRILDGVREKKKNQILDEVGEWKEFGMVENNIEIGDKHDDVGEKGEGIISASKGSLTVSDQRRLIQLLSDAGANELNPELLSADPCQSADPPPTPVLGVIK